MRWTAWPVGWAPVGLLVPSLCGLRGPDSAPPAGTPWKSGVAQPGRLLPVSSFFSHPSSAPRRDPGLHFPRSLQGTSALLLAPFEASQGSLLSLTHTSGALLAGSFPDAPSQPVLCGCARSELQAGPRRADRHSACVPGWGLSAGPPPSPRCLPTAGSHGLILPPAARRGVSEAGIFWS